MANKLRNSSSPVDEKSVKLKQISSVIRALVTSRKPPCALNDILHDYKDVEGCSLEYRQMGFKTVEDLLMETGEFQLNKFGGKTCISARYSDKSAHIVALVRGQKSSKSKMSLSKPRPPSRIDHNWNKKINSTQFNKNYNTLHRGGTAASASAAGDRNNNEIKYNSNNVAGYKSTNSNNKQQYDLRERITQQKQEKQAQKPKQLQSQAQHQMHKSQETQNNGEKSTAAAVTKPRAILGQKNTSNNKSNNNNNHSDNNNEKNELAKQQQHQMTQQEHKTKQTSQKPKEKSNMQKNQSSNIQNRLRITDRLATVRPDLPVHADIQFRAPLPVPSVVEQTVLPPKVFQFNPNLDAITSLSQYCVVRGSTAPEYKILHSKFSKLFQCRILFNNSIYSTYPSEYPTEQQARIACAQIAIDQIRQQEQRNPLPMCTDSDKGLIEKLYTELVEHPHGIFVKNMPECFENTYKHTLPDHWWTLVQTSNRFITETLANDKVIILANTTSAVTDEMSIPQSPLIINNERSITSYVQNTNHNNNQVALEDMSLPWQSKYWNVHATYCVSTVEIWVRLIGPEYSEHFDAVYNDIACAEKQVAGKVVIDNIYLAFMSDGWHRVRVRELEKQKNLALCHFIDFGETDWLPVGDLCICESRYLSLPEQAVSLALFGLEDFAEHPFARTILITKLLNSSFVAEILTKETEFYADQQQIRVVLYDTSSDVDINTNSILLQLFCDSTPQPELKQTGITKVHITTVTDHGDIFVQIIGSGLLYVEKLIQQLVESKFKRDQHQVNIADLERADLFLISNGDSNIRWYRGKLAPNQTISPKNDIFDVMFIDHGTTHSVHISKLFRLESLSAALSKFPAQAIKVQLHNIPPLTAGIVGRMRALLPNNCEALIKLVVPADVPLVTVYRRIEGPDTLCTINDVIRIEHELECSLETNTDFTGTTKTTSNWPSSKPAGVVIGEHVSHNDMVQRKILNPVPINNNLKSENFQKLKTFNDFPVPGQYFQVRVGFVANPSIFNVQPYSMYKELCSILKNLQIYCNNNEESIPVDGIEIGEAYAAKNSDGYYHRVIVENKINAQMIKVCFCDFGDFTVLHFSQLKILPQEYRNLPKMAIAAKLYNAKPINDDWSLSNCKRFRELTLGKKFVSVIQKISKNEVDEPILTLELIDVETEVDIYIHKVLQAEQHIR